MIYILTITSKGDFSKTYKFFRNASKLNFTNILNKYGSEGVRALASVTPVDSGETANSWAYEISSSKDGATITWVNTNVVNGAPIAILLQYGHGTGTGGYVQGRDYINPVLKPIFDKIANDAWKEVTQP